MFSGLEFSTAENVGTPIINRRKPSIPIVLQKEKQMRWVLCSWITKSSSCAEEEYVTCSKLYCKRRWQNTWWRPRIKCIHVQKWKIFGIYCNHLPMKGSWFPKKRKVQQGLCFGSTVENHADLQKMRSFNRKKRFSHRKKGFFWQFFRSILDKSTDIWTSIKSHSIRSFSVILCDIVATQNTQTIRKKSFKTKKWKLWEKNGIFSFLRQKKYRKTQILRLTRTLKAGVPRECFAKRNEAMKLIASINGGEKAAKHEAFWQTFWQTFPLKHRQKETANRPLPHHKFSIFSENRSSSNLNQSKHSPAFILMKLPEINNFWLFC